MPTQNLFFKEHIEEALKQGLQNAADAKRFHWMCEHPREAMRLLAAEYTRDALCERIDASRATCEFCRRDESK